MTVGVIFTLLVVAIVLCIVALAFYGEGMTR